MNPVFILSLFDTGLYTARLLKNENTIIYGFDHDPDNPGFYSKYITPFLVPNPQDEPDRLLEILLEKSKEFPLKPVLIAATENYLEFVFHYREILERFFLFLLPSNELLGKIINKSSQLDLARNLGFYVPPYHIVTSYKELNGLEITFPVIIKGVDQPSWKNRIKKKNFVVSGRDELLMIGNNLLDQKVSFIVQKIIDGDCTNNFEYNALVCSGKVIEESVIQKIRQYPIGFGYGCCIQTVRNDEIIQLGKKFVINNKLDGFSNTEFKKDPINGNFYFIETNSRVWQQIELTNKNGQNYILSYYNLLTQRTFKNHHNRSKEPLRWVDFPTDLLLYIRYRHQIRLGTFDFIKSTFNASNYGLFSLRDIRPFLKSNKLIK